MTSALITVFHPGPEVPGNAAVIARQVDTVYICDNSPTSHRELFASIPNLHYICFGENLGISRAFNRILKDESFPWQDSDYLLFFDQDSLIEEDHIEQLIRVYEDVRGAGLPIGCLGPAYFNTSRGCVETPRNRRDITADAYAVSSIITSSMLTTYAALRQVGFWNEDVFLDMADWDLCWRMAKAGLLCCMTEKAVFRHTLGNGEKKVGPLRLRVATPFREYYQLRESSYLFWKSYTPMKYRIRFLAMLLVRCTLHLIFLDHRRERLSYMLRGLGDFFRGKHGALDAQ